MRLFIGYKKLLAVKALHSTVEFQKEIVMFKHIFIPTDGSKLSQMAMQKAAQFAKEMGARVTIFYAKPEFPVNFYVEGVPIDTTTSEQFSEFADKQALAILGAAEETCAKLGVPCQAITDVGDVPYEMIVKKAIERNCDLIFMASHGRRGITSFLLGSETYRVLTHATIPVLVFRTAEDTEE